MLIVFGGLPGSGKSTIARKLAASLSAVYLRIDSIEQAIRVHPDCKSGQIGAEGYVTAYAVAQDNLNIGLTVIADSVNALPITREAWQAVAREAKAQLLEIEIICSDSVLHRQRVERRQADIAGMVLPDWQQVMAREYTPWQSAALRIDTAMVSVEEAVAAIIAHAAR